jgi:hypothetical protein
VTPATKRLESLCPSADLSAIERMRRLSDIAISNQRSIASVPSPQIVSALAIESQ